MKFFSLILVIILIPLFVLAGPPTNLTADNIVHDNLTGNIEASGEVTIIQAHLTLKTNKLIYNASTDSIIITGSFKIYEEHLRER